MTRFKQSQHHGFTLLEVLLVLVVLSVMVSLLITSFSDNTANQLSREAQRLSRLLQTMSDEALLQGVEYSLAIGSSAEASQSQGYQFLQYNYENLMWEPINDPAFSFYVLPEKISFSLALNGDEIFTEFLKAANTSNRSKTKVRVQPAILIVSSGEVTPFEITLSHKDTQASLRIVSDGISGVEIQ